METFYLILTILGIVLFIGLSYLRFKFLEDVRRNKFKSKGFYIWFPGGYLIYFFKKKMGKSYPWGKGPELVRTTPCRNSGKGEREKPKSGGQHFSQHYIKTMLRPASFRNFALACCAWLSCGQSSSPARTVFIRDVAKNAADKQNAEKIKTDLN